MIFTDGDFTLGSSVTAIGNGLKASAASSGGYNGRAYGTSIGGVIYAGGDLTIGDDSVFTGNYVDMTLESKGNPSNVISPQATTEGEVFGGAIGAEESVIVGNKAIFANNYVNLDAYSYAEMTTSGDGRVTSSATYDIKGSGGAIYSADKVTVGGDAVFEGNHVLVNASQGIYVSGDNTRDTSFFANGVLYAQGGAISGLNVEIGDGTLFTGNHVIGTIDTDNSLNNTGTGGLQGTGMLFSYVHGGAVSVFDRSIREEVGILIGNNVSFIGNYAEVYGTNVSELTGSNINISSSGVSNPGQAQGGALDAYSWLEAASMTVGQNSLFQHNHVYGNTTAYGTAGDAAATSVIGGAIAVYSYVKSAGLVLESGSVFDHNYAYSEASGDYTQAIAAGGAIYLEGRTSATVRMDAATFTDNYALNLGGAIYLINDQINTEVSTILALSGNTEFTGNKVGGTPAFDSEGKLTGVTDGRASAIHLVGDHRLELAAADGKIVLFNDPVTSSNTTNLTLSINRYSDASSGFVTTEGRVVFSGENHQGSEIHQIYSRYNNILADVTVYGGTMELRSGVIFGRQNVAGGVLTLNDGATLLSTNGPNQINMETIVLSGTVSLGDYDTSYLTLVGDVLLDDATLVFDLGENNQSDLIVTSGTLNASSTAAVNFSSWNDGTYTVIRADAVDKDNYTLGPLGPRLHATLDDSTASELIVSTSTDSERCDLIFTGNTSNVWATPIYDNWKLASNGNIDNFIDIDYVIFDGASLEFDIGIDLNGVIVSGMRVTAGEYNFTGGSITGGIHPSFGQTVTGRLDITGAGTHARFENALDFEKGAVIGSGAAMTVTGDAVNGLDTDSSGTINLEGDGRFIFGDLTNNGLVRFQNLGNVLESASLSGTGVIALEVDMENGLADTVVVSGNVTGLQVLALSATSTPGSSPIAPITLVFASNNTGDGIISGDLDYGAYNYQVYTEDGNKSWQLAKKDGSYSSGTQAIVNTIGAMSTSWFSQLDNLTKRMGELRMGNASSRKNDLWVRGYGSQINTDLGIAGMSEFREYQYGVDMGIDQVFTLNKDSNVAVGVFAGWQGSDRRFRDGHGSTGDSDSIYGGVYGTWMHKDGWYADSVIKGQYNDNSYSARGSHGSFETGGLGVSLEGGRQIALEKNWFIEPSIQFAYLHTSSNSFSSNGIPVTAAASDIYRFSGQLRGGRTYTLSNGRLMQAYLKAGIEEQVSNGGSVKVASEKLGPNTDGTRGVVGAGLIWQIGDRSQIHADYEYGFGEKYDRPWSVNLGYRYSF